MAGTAIDLSQLPAPTIVETLDYETIRAALLATMVSLLPTWDASVESDPVVKLLEVAAYRELLIRQDFNERAKQTMLAYATGTNLTNLVALLGVERQADESDASLLARALLAPDAMSVAGPESAYRYHVKTADSTVADVSAISPTPTDIKALVETTLAAQGVSSAIRATMRAALDAATWPGTVTVSLLSASGDGTASAEQIATANAALDDDVVPLTDLVVVQSAQIVPYAITASLTLFDGPDGDTVLAAAQASVAAYVANARALGRDINRTSIIAALCVAGVSNVALSSPAADLVMDSTQAGHCTGITITVAGRGE
ncbi:baseplate assembly protein [Novosphingobium umbonatum]|uniref:Baseplate assembly protein n=1 Tax=Novosphingobium umbonatum TaxID=1908524 RepID=A0A3S2VRP0_9SPHN|nr:baseplate J/gp47 family protein [Novosphingobium umbonatum]RVU03931.1 baseplate assembly protein [Novosphingobium umbonatum]